MCAVSVLLWSVDGDGGDGGAGGCAGNSGFFLPVGGPWRIKYPRCFLFGGLGSSCSIVGGPVGAAVGERVPLRFPRRCGEFLLSSSLLSSSAAGDGGCQTASRVEAIPRLAGFGSAMRLVALASSTTTSVGDGGDVTAFTISAGFPALASVGDLKSSGCAGRTLFPPRLVFLGVAGEEEAVAALWNNNFPRLLPPTAGVFLLCQWCGRSGLSRSRRVRRFFHFHGPMRLLSRFVGCRSWLRPVVRAATIWRYFCFGVRFVGVGGRVFVFLLALVGDARILVRGCPGFFLGRYAIKIMALPQMRGSQSSSAGAVIARESAMMHPRVKLKRVGLARSARTSTGFLYVSCCGQVFCAFASEQLFLLYPLDVSVG